jgi:hypothetical protein
MLRVARIALRARLAGGAAPERMLALPRPIRMSLAHPTGIFAALAG